MKNNFLKFKDEMIKAPKMGEIIEGKVVGIDRSSIFIDLGTIGTGIIYGREFQEAKDILKSLKIGDEIFSKIVELENENGYIELSISEANKEMGLKKIKEIKRNEETIKIKVQGANKGGLLTDIFGIPAFLPVSQLSSQHYPQVKEAERSKIAKELQKFIGTEMEVKIITLDLEEKRLIVSEKAKELENIKKILKNFKVGDTVEGEITKITNFGAFIKFPFKEIYLEGLIHISELDWQLINDPSEIVKVGEKIKVKIIEITDSRIFLSLKALKKDPWEDIETKYKKGETVTGKVVKLDNFGALIQLDKTKIQALCHISEFASKTKMEETIEIGKKYNFKILSLSSKEHKMTLSFVKP